MYNTVSDAWGNKVYTVITIKVGKKYETIVFYHEPYTMDVKRIETFITTNWFKKLFNHYKMVRQYIWNNKNFIDF